MSSLSVFQDFYNCSLTKCKISKALSNEYDKHLNAKLAKLEELKKEHSNDVMKMYKEVKKLTQSYLKDMKKWDNYKEINIHNECIKNNCKVFLIHFIEKMVPVFEKQIEIFESILKNITLSADEIQIFKMAIKKLKLNIKSIKNIHKWTDKKFDNTLYNFFAVKKMDKMFTVQE